jgi:hypothetical protein
MKRPAWLFFSMLALIIILILPAVSPDAAHAQAVEPVISGISPDTASGGTDSEITITGTGFGGAPAQSNFYISTQSRRVFSRVKLYPGPTHPYGWSYRLSWRAMRLIPMAEQRPGEGGHF